MQGDAVLLPGRGVSPVHFPLSQEVGWGCTSAKPLEMRGKGGAGDLP